MKINAIFKMVQSAYEYGLSGCKMNKKQDKIIFKRGKYIFILHYIDYGRTELNIIYQDEKSYEMIAGPTKSLFRLLIGEEQWYIPFYSGHRKEVNKIYVEVKKELEMLYVKSVSA